MRLVSISPYVPHPRINHAGGRFLFEYLPRMAKHMDVTLIAPGSPENQIATAYAPDTIDVHLFGVGPGWHRLMWSALEFPVDTAVGFTDGMTILSSFRSDPRVTEILRSSSVVEVQFSQYLPLLRVIQMTAPDAALTAHEHDVFIDHLDEKVAAASRPIQRWRAKAQRRRIGLQEPGFLNLCDLVVTHNQKDRSRLREIGVRSPVEAVYPPITIPAAAADVFGNDQVSFVGAMWRVENQRGAEWLTQSVWPRVVAQHPSARLVIAGDGPDHVLRRLRTHQSISTTGFLPSLDVVYQSTSVSAVPVHGSAGIKVKALEAMAFGLPVVSTRPGAAGIAGHAGNDVFAAITDDADAFAAAVIACLRDGARAREIGRRARQWVLANCDFDDAVNRIAGAYGRLAATPLDM